MELECSTSESEDSEHFCSKCGHPLYKKNNDTKKFEYTHKKPVIIKKLLTDEEKKEKQRISAKKYYDKNKEKISQRRKKKRDKAKQ